MAGAAAAGTVLISSVSSSDVLVAADRLALQLLAVNGDLGLSGSSSGAGVDSSPVVWMPTWEPSGSTIQPMVVLAPRAR